MRLFDLHCDTIYECYFSGQPLLLNKLHLDLTRGLQYDAWAQAFAVWMPDRLRGLPAFQQCCRLLSFALEQMRINRERITPVKSGRDMEDALRNHRCAAVLTVEGGSALAGRLENLDVLHDFGVKSITLTWNGSNEWGHGSASGCEQGLTDFGKTAVGRMEELGMVPDVSHLNERGFWDVLEHTARPVIASHSPSAHVHPHPRNLTDRQFEAIRDRGGLVGLNLCREHLGEQTFDRFERHLDQYLSLGGEKTVAVGCDLDGTELPPSWGGIAVIGSLYRYLQSKNYDETLLDRLFFSNCYDFFQNSYHRFDN